MPLIRNDAAASQWLCAKTRGIQWQMVFDWPKSFKDLDIKAVPAVPILLPLEVFFETPRRSPGFQDSVGASRKDGMVIKKTDSIEALETLKQEYRTHTSDVLFAVCVCFNCKTSGSKGKEKTSKAGKLSCWVPLDCSPVFQLRHSNCKTFDDVWN